MPTRTKNIFINLPVKDLQKSMDYFSEIGFEFDERFTDQNATCMILGENIFAMLLVEDFFKTFINKEISDASRSCEVILSLSAESREEVDEIVGKALRAGGRPVKDPADHGFMYVRSFEDINGHQWEVMYMDPSALQAENH